MKIAAESTTSEARMSCGCFDAPGLVEAWDANKALACGFGTMRQVPRPLEVSITNR